MSFKSIMIFILGLLLFPLVTYNQKIIRAVPENEFERMIIGDTLFYKEGALKSSGKANNKTEIIKVIGELNDTYDLIAKKEGKRFDSLKAIIFSRIAYSYWAMSLFDTSTDYNSKIISSHKRALLFARKARLISIISKSYMALLTFYNLLIEDQINLLNEWIKDYNSWINQTGISKYQESPYSRLATIYRFIGNDEKQESILKDWLKNAITPIDKIFAYSEIVNYYDRQERWQEINEYATHAVKIQINKNDLNEQHAIAMASLYIRLVESKLALKDFSGITFLIDQVQPNLYCFSCTHLAELAFWKTINSYLKAKYYLALKEPAKAFTYLQQPLIQPDKDYLYYEYYKQVGDSTNAFVFLEKYRSFKDEQNATELSVMQSENSQGLELLKGYETRFIKEEAEKTKLLQEQKMIALEKQNEIEKIKSESERQSLLAAAENSELKRKIETDSLQSDALKTKKEQEYKVLLLNKDIKSKNRTKIILVSGLVLVILFAGLLIFQNRQKQRANHFLVLQKKEIEQQRDQITKALSELKAAQSQLIQQEKMASLGELTAGIAHEIQNPLNFVNNFSEVSNELVDEMKTELSTGNVRSANEIADDIKQNLEKINHHGKRAEGIVKSMLQHSRSSSGKKEPTDINGLCDEYLRLAYHGMRAKDKTFSATTKTEFDNSIEKIKVNPQDIGRVILNLINNAFYTVSEKKNNSELSAMSYEPTVIVSTKREKNRVEIKVKDNGNGIPQKILDKIFQPFFTTKPTGQGTGLGLSLAYDIVTKGHGGELKIETKEGEGSSFIIQLPVN